MCKERPASAADSHFPCSPPHTRARQQRVLVALAALLAVAVAEDALLLTSKDFANNVAVAEEELTVVYTIYNVGEG